MTTGQPLVTPMSRPSRPTVTSVAIVQLDTIGSTKRVAGLVETLVDVSLTVLADKPGRTQALVMADLWEGVGMSSLMWVIFTYIWSRVPDWTNLDETGNK